MSVITNGTSITCSFVRTFPVKCTTKQKTNIPFSHREQTIMTSYDFELQAHFAEVQAYIYNKTQGKTQLHRQYLWFRYKETILADNVFSFHQLQVNICTDVKCY